MRQCKRSGLAGINPAMTMIRTGRAGAFGVCIGMMLIFISLGGCSSWVTRAQDKFAHGLSTAFADQGDPETVAAALPAYLLMLDALISEQPDSAQMLRSAAALYGFYGGSFVTDAQRKRLLTDKAMNYALRGVCARMAQACGLRNLSVADLEHLMAVLNADDVQAFYALGTVWAGWIQARSDNWDAIAELAQVEVIMRRLVELDERYDAGGAHMYLGVMAALMPEALGGDPQQARAHFERAVAISGGRSLMPKVLYAEHYARLVFDRDLHDRLLKEVVADASDAPGFRLANVLARRRAQQLLDSADGYF